MPGFFKKEKNKMMIDLSVMISIAFPNMGILDMILIQAVIAISQLKTMTWTTSSNLMILT